MKEPSNTNPISEAPAETSPSTNDESSSSTSSVEPAPQKSALTSCVVSLRRIPSADIPNRSESVSETDITTDECSNIESPEKRLLSPPLFMPKPADVEPKHFNFDKNLHKKEDGEESALFQSLNKGQGVPVIGQNKKPETPMIVKPVARKSTGPKAYAPKSTGGKFFIASRLAAGTFLYVAAKQCYGPMLTRTFFSF